MAALRDRVDCEDLQDEVDGLHIAVPNTPMTDKTKQGLLLLLITTPWLILASVEMKRQAAVSELSRLRANRTGVSSPLGQAKNATQVPGDIDDGTFPDSGNDSLLGMSEDNFFIHTVYDDLHYRRVCAPVHSSHICLTMRYPFPIPQQDSKTPYAKPVQELFYDEEVNVHFVDGMELEACMDRAETVGDAAVKACLDLHHDATNSDKSTATAVWSRIRNGETELYGIDSDEQRQRVHDYFRNQVVIVLGASPSPPITETLHQLFDECQRVDKWDGLGSLHPFHGLKSLKSGQDVCLPQDARDDSLTRWKSLTHKDEWTMLLHDSFYPADHGHTFYNHSIPDGLSIVPELEKIKDFSGWDRVKFTLIIEHPIAHIQNQDLMEMSYDYSVSLQNKWTQVFLNATQGDPYDKLKADGLEFSLIAFDGSPQFFPTESGGYTGKIHPFKTEEEFLKQGGYEGWTPDMGSRCRGFLPPTGNLTKFNDLGRKFYEQNGLDMQWYGRTWEFINMVWFSVKGTNGWGNKGLDCTHGHGAGSAVSNMHKFFLMAMIDDHFDNTA